MPTSFNSLWEWQKLVQEAIKRRLAVLFQFPMGMAKAALKSSPNKPCGFQFPMGMAKGV